MVLNDAVIEGDVISSQWSGDKSWFKERTNITRPVSQQNSARDVRVAAARERKFKRYILKNVKVVMFEFKFYNIIDRGPSSSRRSSK